MFRGVTPVGHSNLTDIGSSTKGFLEILSKVLERSLSFTYGRPDESCSSFTLMYFGKHRASRINFSGAGAIFKNWLDTLFIDL